MVGAVGVGTVGGRHSLSLNREEILAGGQVAQCAHSRADASIEGVLGAFLLNTGRGDVAVAGTELQIVLIARKAPAAALKGPCAARAHLAVVQLAPGAPVGQRRAYQVGAVHLEEDVNLLGEQRLQFHHAGQLLVLRLIGQHRPHHVECLQHIVAPFGQVLVGHQLFSVGNDALQAADVIDLRDGHHLDIGNHHAGCEALGHEHERCLVFSLNGRDHLRPLVSDGLCRSHLDGIGRLHETAVSIEEDVQIVFRVGSDAGAGRRFGFNIIGDDVCAGSQTDGLSQGVADFRIAFKAHDAVASVRRHAALNRPYFGVDVLAVLIRPAPGAVSEVAVCEDTCAHALIAGRVRIVIVSCLQAGHAEERHQKQ